jgi:hypothetical protein
VLGEAAVVDAVDGDIVSGTSAVRRHCHEKFVALERPAGILPDRRAFRRVRRVEVPIRAAIGLVAEAAELLAV